MCSDMILNHRLVIPCRAMANLSSKIIIQPNGKAVVKQSSDS